MLAREIREASRAERARSRELQQALRELRQSYLSAIEALAALVEAKDAGTRMHLERTSRYGMALARAIAPDLAARPELGYGFLLHDIGKVGISERILTKPGPLTPSEWSVMKRHPLMGARVVASMSFLGEAVEVIRSHHERWDGTGYPRGLAGRKIPLGARIFSVVDAFDAMTSDRPYRRAMPVERAVEEIATAAGSQFDPEVVTAFMGLMEDRVVPQPPSSSGW